MWDEQSESEQANKYEKNFQTMLINNMESVIQIFFRGVEIYKIKPQSKNKSGIYHSLNELEKKGIVETRIRHDTKVKQYHAG